MKAIRGFSDFGFSYVYVVFEDGTDIYWARSRVLEYLSKIQPRLARGGPDRAGARRDRRRLGLPVRARRIAPARCGPEELRSLQDWTVRYALQAVPGVSEVASIGGFVRQYQITVDPNKLAAYDLPLEEVVDGRPQEQQRGGRATDRVERARVHGARARLRPHARRLRDRSSLKVDAGRRAGPVARRRPRRARPRDPPRRCRPRRHAARRSAASSSCATARTR